MKPKGLWLAALACLIGGLVWLYYSTRADALPDSQPQGRWLLAQPHGARVAINRRSNSSGETPKLYEPGAMTQIRLEKFGYQSLDLTVTSDFAWNQPQRLKPSWLFPFTQPLLCLSVLFAFMAFVHQRMGAVSSMPEEETSPPGEIGPGTQLGRYRLTRRIGAGSMAEVFQAEDDKGNRVAVKVLFHHISQSEEFRIRFEREAEMCARLDHPRLIKTYAWSVLDGRYWMAQTYLPGSTLQSWVTPAGMQPGQVKKVLIQIAEGLEHAHEQGVFHRDLKPENILLNSKGEPVIADFGIARSPNYQTITHQQHVLGTPAFISPEQIEGVRLDGRSDLYSLGVIGYELLSGKLPFEGQPMDVLIKHLKEDPPPLRELRPGIPPEYEQIIMKLLSKNPDDRYPTARDLVHALQQL